MSHIEGEKFYRVYRNLHTGGAPGAMQTRQSARRKEEPAEAKRAKKEAAPPPSGVEPLSKEEAKEVDRNRARNLQAVGKWEPRGDDELDALELFQAGDFGMEGDAVVSGCEVRLRCVNLLDETMQFRAVFRTERQDYIGIMTICVVNRNKLHIEYFNGGHGRGKGFLDCDVKRKK